MTIYTKAATSLPEHNYEKVTQFNVVYTSEGSVVTSDPSEPFKVVYTYATIGITGADTISETGTVQYTRSLTGDYNGPIRSSVWSLESYDDSVTIQSQTDESCTIAVTSLPELDETITLTLTITYNDDHIDSQTKTITIEEDHEDDPTINPPFDDIEPIEEGE